jgi:HlyD family secretion protein
MAVPAARNMIATLAVCWLLGSPAAPDPRAAVRQPRTVRLSGTVRAVRFHVLVVPQIAGAGGRLTLARLVPNGAQIRQGDLLAQFDATQQVEQARDAEAKLNDLTHQVEQKKAEVRSNAAKRLAQLRESEAELAKAELKLTVAAVLSEIDRLKNEAKAECAKAALEALRQMHHHRGLAEAAAVRVLELQRDRQQVALERIRGNMDKLLVRAPMDGMVALENVWRGGSMGPAQEGDQLWPGYPLLRIFDPSEMAVETAVSEADWTLLPPAATARVLLDAYPDAVFEGRLETASPVATSGVDNPIKTFTARFRIVERDPRLLPDLSAAIEIDAVGPTAHLRAVAGKERP